MANVDLHAGVVLGGDQRISGRAGGKKERGKEGRRKKEEKKEEM